MTCFAPRSLLSSFLSTLLVLHGLLAPVRAEAPALFGLDDIPLASARLTPPDPSSKLLGLGEIDLSRSRRWAALQEQVRPRAAELPELAGLEQPALDPHLERYIAQPLRQTGEHLSGLFSNEQQVAGVLEQIKQGGVDIEQKLVQAGEEKLQAMVDSGLDNVTQRLQGSILPQLELSYRAPFSGREELFHANATLSLWESPDTLLFGQGGLLLRDGEDGANLGLGYRFLAGEGLLLGVNTFYDWLSDPDVERWSVGVEARSAWLDLHANWYQGRGNDRDGDTLYYSPDGWDVEIAAHLPEAPWVELGASYYLWEGEGGQDDLEGLRYGLSLKPFTLWNIGFEYDDPDGDGGSWGVKTDLNYQFGVPLSNQLALRGTQGTPDLWSRRYEKVEREYAIRVREQRTSTLRTDRFSVGFAQLIDGVDVPVRLPAGRFYERSRSRLLLLPSTSYFTVTEDLPEDLPGEIRFTATRFSEAEATLTLTYAQTPPITIPTGTIGPIATIRITVLDTGLTGNSGDLSNQVIVEVLADEPTTARLLVGRSLPSSSMAGCSADTCVVPDSTGMAVSLPVSQVPLTPVEASTCDNCQVSLAFDLQFAGTAVLGTDYTVTGLTLTPTRGDISGSDSTGPPIDMLPTTASDTFMVTLNSLSTHYLNVTLTLMPDTNPDTDGERKDIQLVYVDRGDDGMIDDEDDRGAPQTVLTLEPAGTRLPFASVADTTLTERSLVASTATVVVTLSDSVYVETSALDTADFTLTTDVPGTVTVAGVTRTSATETILTLRHEGADIVDISGGVDGTLDVIVEASAHSSAVALYAGSVSIDAMSGVATLSGLTVSPGALTPPFVLTPPFAPDTIGYTLTVASTVTSVILTATTTDAGATVSVDGSPPATSGSTTTIGGLTSGDTRVVPIVVTAEDGRTMTYRVRITNAPDLMPTFGSQTVAPQRYTVGADVGTVRLPEATGGDGALSYTLTPALPNGLSFDANTRQITGAPTATVAETPYTLTATDSDVTTPPDQATLSFLITVVAAGPVTVGLDANIAGDDVVNIAERMAGFPISGTVDAGAMVEVTLAGGSTRNATVSGATWTLDIPADDPEITGASVVVEATATLAGGTGTASRTITVDLVAPTATYTPPASLTVGTAITAITPTSPSADINAYAVQSGSLPPGLTLAVGTGVIDGIPSTANASTADVTIRLTDEAGNPNDVEIDFPMVAMGSQTLTGFAYTPTTVALNAPTPPTVTLPSGVQTGSTLSYTSGDAAICTVDATGALTLVGAGACVITVTASATTNYNEASADFTITVAAAGAAGVTVTSTTLSVPEDGGEGTYTLVLTSAPTADVTIAVESDTTSAATVSPASLTFSTTNWDTAQTVTVTGVNDNDVNTPNRTATVTHAATSTDTDYNLVSIDSVTVTVEDDDVAAAPGVTVNPMALMVDEAGSGTTADYTLVLDTAPTADVTIAVASDTVTAATVSSASLTFTTANWNTAQTVTVTGVNDDVDNPSDIRTATVTHTAASADGNYSGGAVTIASVTVTVDDDDDAGVTVSETERTVSEDGNSRDTYTLVLDTVPTAEVTIAVASSDTLAATVSSASLTFTTTDWNTAQTVTVTGVNDDVDNPSDSDRTATVSHTAMSGDVNYDDGGAITIASVTVTVTDDDDAGITVSGTVLAVAEADGTGAYTLILDTQPAADVTIAVASDATMVATVSPASLTFTSTDWNTAQTVTVTGVDDTINNTPPRTATVSHTATSTDTNYNAEGIDPVTVTATDDDAALPVISIAAGPSVDEGTSVTFTVTADPAPVADLAVTVTVDDGAGDFIAGDAPTTVTIAASATESTLMVATMADTDDEPNGVVTAALRTGTGYMVGAPDTASVAVRDDDGATDPVISIAAAPSSVTEGTSATFTVTATPAPAAELTVMVTVDDGAGNFIAGDAPTTVTIGASNTEATLEVATMADSIDEANGMITATVTIGAGYTMDGTNNTASVTVEDDDAEPTLAISSPSVPEGNSGSVMLRYTVTLTGATEREVTVEYADAGTGTATSGTDYETITAGTLTFTPGDATTQDIDVTVTGDAIDEGNGETVIVMLSNPTNATIATADGTGTITDDDDPPMLAIDSPSVAEGGAGETPTLTYTVTLNGATERTVTVDYMDATGTGSDEATSGTDYTAIAPGTLTFVPGTTTQTITVMVTGDVDEEGDETVIVTLSGETNATIATADGTGTIRGDDAPVLPTISIAAGPSPVTEADNATFTLTADPAPGTNLIVTVTVDDGAGNFIASPAPTMVTITASTTTATLMASTNDDTTDEADGMITATVTAGAGYTIALSPDNSATVTVTDNDPPPTLAIDSPTVLEGDGGSTAMLRYTVTLSGDTEQEVTVAYADAAGTAGDGTATPDTDYETLTAGTLTFTPGGANTQNINVIVTGDAIDEENETVVLRLSGAVNAMITTPDGAGTITDDDATPTLAIDSPSVGEGNSGSTTLSYTVTLTGDTEREVTVDYADAGTGTATSGADYDVLTAGTLTFAPGTTTQNIDVTVTGDTEDEGDAETVIVRLSNPDPVDATITAVIGTGTITDDDDPTLPAISIAAGPSPVTEGDDATFTLTANPAPMTNLTVTVTVDDGAGDFIASPAPTMVTITASNTTVTLTVMTEDDTTDEAEGMIMATVTPGAGYTVSSSSTARVTVRDNDIVITGATTGAVTEDAPTDTATGALVVDGDFAPQTGATDRANGLGMYGNFVLAANGGWTYALDNTLGDPQGDATNALAGGDIQTEVFTAVSAADSSVEREVTITITGANDAPTADAGLMQTVTQGITVTLDGSGSSDPDTGDMIDAYAWTQSGTPTVTLSDATIEMPTFLAPVVTSETDLSFSLVVNDGDTDSAAPDTVTITVNPASAPPVVSTVEISSTGPYGVGDVIEVTVTFSEIVTVVGDPQIALTVGTTTRQAVYDSGTGATAVFLYTVAAGDSDDNGVSIDANSLTQVAGSTIQDTDDNDATLTHTAVDADLDQVVDTTAPTVSMVELSSDGPYALDEDIEVTVTFSEVVIVDTTGGTPQIPLTVGSAPQQALYDSGSDTTALLFRYTVAAGDTDADGVSIDADVLALNSGTIQDTAGNDVALDNPAVAPDTAHVVDTAAPTLVSGSSAVNGSTITLVYNEPLDGDSTPATTTYTVAVDSGDTPTVTGVTISGTEVSLMLSAPVTSDQTVTVSYTAGSSTPLQDLAGNDAIGLSDEDVTNNTPMVLPTISIAAGTSPVTEADNATFTLTAAPTPGTDLIVTVTVTETGTFISGSAPTTVTITASTTTATLTVAIDDDSIDEAPGMITATVTAGTGYMVDGAGNTASIMVNDNDAAPTLAIDSPRMVTEGDDGDTATLSYTVTLAGDTTQEVTVDYADAGTAGGGTATSGADYEPITGGTLTFAPGGATTQTIDVTVRGDIIDEPNEETVIVMLSNPVNATIATNTGTGTITDNDPEPMLAIDSPNMFEGDDGDTATLRYTVTLSGDTEREVTVGYADAGAGTAESGTDYEALTRGTLTFAPGGATALNIDVTVMGDLDDEGDEETVVVRLSGAVNATITTPDGTGTITDDDDPPALAIDSPRVDEGDSGPATLSYTVTLTGTTAQTVMVDYADAGSGTATSGTDYETITGGTLIFTPGGATTQTIAVTVTGDTIDEANETVILRLSNPVEATITPPDGIGTITDDDDPPILTISSPTMNEGNSGRAMLRYVVTSGDTEREVTVDYADLGTGTATSGTDYDPITAGTLTFAPGGAATQNIDVMVVGDTTDEANETVILRLSGAVNATIATADGTGTITDDDAEPTLAINSLAVPEGDSGSMTRSYTVTLNGATARTVTVDYADSGSGTATSGADYDALTAGTLTFTPGGAATQTIDLMVRGDTIDEENQTIIVTLSNPDNAMIATDLGTMTITDDDAEPTLAINSPSVGEGDSGTATLPYTVRLTGMTEKEVTVDYADASAGSAESGADYETITAATLTFTPGTTTRDINVTVRGDTIDEPNETVIITLSGAVNAMIIAGTGTGMITDDDAAGVSVSETERMVTEADGTADYTVVLDTEPSNDVTIAVESDAETVATVSPPSLTFTSTDWNTAQTVTVTGVNDNVDNPGNARTASLSHTATSLDTNYGSVPIASVDVTVNDDDDPEISIAAGAAVIEGAAATFTLTATSAPGTALTVTVTVDDGAGNFITGAPTTVTIAASDTTAMLEVPTTNDTTDEVNGMITATVEGGTGYTVASPPGNTASVTVNDNDDPPTLAIDSPSVTEGNSGTATLSYTVTLTGGTEREVTVRYAGSGGTATSGADYDAITAGTLTFAPGTTTQPINVTVRGDTVDEPNETVIVTLSTPVNATIESGTGTGTITDDDGPVISIAAGAAVTEGMPATFTLTATSAPAANLTITVTVTDSGNFISSPAPTTVTIAASDMTATLMVPTDDDNTDEVTGMITATVETGTGYTVDATNNSASVTVNDDDEPTLAIDSPSVAEGDSATATLRYTVTLTGGTEREVTVQYAGSGGTATSGADYEAITAGTLTFAPGTTTQNIDVTVRGDVDDEVDETVILRLSGAVNATITTADGTGTITDDDDPALPSISIAADTSPVTEGTAATFTLTASSAPAANLTVTVTVTDSGNFIAGAAPTTVTIAASATTATLMVPTMADSINEANGMITATVETGTGYTVDATNNSASVTVNDDDDAGVTVTPLALTVPEDGSTDTYTLVLDTLPTADVTIAVESDTATVATVSSATLSFTTANWNTPQTVTVTGVNDDVDNPGNERTASLSHTPASTDSDYNGGAITIASVSVTVTDDDVAGVSVVPTMITVDDAGSGTADYTVVLDSRPTAVVTITPTSGDTGLATVSGALSFAPAAWNVAQTVTVTGVDDGIENAVPRMTAITHAIDSTDGGYGSLDVDDVSVTGASLPVAGLFGLVPPDDLASEENNTDLAEVDLRLSPVPEAPLTVRLEITPTTALGDYQLVAGGRTLSPAGGTDNVYEVDVGIDGMVRLQVRALNDADEISEVLTLTLMSGDGYSVSVGERSRSVTLADNDIMLPQVSISSGRDSIFEGQGVRLSLTVRDEDMSIADTHPELVVDYRVTGVSADDYSLGVAGGGFDTTTSVSENGLGGSITIVANAAGISANPNVQAALSLSSVVNSIDDDVELEFTLQPGAGRFNVGQPLRLRIIDVQGYAAEVSLASDAPLVAQEGGTGGANRVEIEVRVAPTPVPVNVGLELVDGDPAPATSDYSVSTAGGAGTLLNPGTQNYVIEFPASNAGQSHRLRIQAETDTDTDSERLSLRLSTPPADGGYELGGILEQPVTLLDADDGRTQVTILISNSSPLPEALDPNRSPRSTGGIFSNITNVPRKRVDLQRTGSGLLTNVRLRITGVNAGLGDGVNSEIFVSPTNTGQGIFFGDLRLTTPLIEDGARSASDFFAFGFDNASRSTFSDIYIWAVQDGISEGAETLRIEVLPPAAGNEDAYVPGTPSSVEFPVEDTSGSSANLAGVRLASVEGGAPAQIDITLGARQIEVPVLLGIDEATGDRMPETGDYALESAPGTIGRLEATTDSLRYRVVFPVSNSTQTHRLLVRALPDNDVDAERLTLVLQSGGLYTVGSGDRAQIEIEDSSQSVEVLPPAADILLEGGDPVIFTVRVPEAVLAELPVDFAVSGVQRADFTLTAESGGTLAFAPGGSSLNGTLRIAAMSTENSGNEIRIALRMVADALRETERLTFRLQDSTDGGYGLALPPAVTEFSVDIEESLLPAVRFDLAASDLVATEGSATDLAQLQIVLDPPATGSMPVNLPLEFRPPPALGDYQVLQDNTPLTADTGAEPGTARYLLSGVNSGRVNARLRAVADLDRTSERINVRLLPGAGYRFPPSGDLEAELSIQEAALMQLSLDFSGGSVEEGGVVMLSLRLSAEAPRPLQVGYRISGVQVGDFELFGDRDGVPGTASDASVLLQDVLVLAADSATASYQLRTSDDSLLEGTETLRLELLPSVDGSYGLGASSAELRINDNDPAQVGFAQARPVAGEAAGTVALQVRSQPAPLTPLQVGYRFNSGQSNVALGVDFMLSGLNADNAGTLTLTPQAPQADITLTLVDDLLNEGPFEEALFELQPGAGYILGQQDTLLRIYDNEAPTSTPRVTFEQVESLVGEGNTARVQLRVEPPSADELTVLYGAMPAGTAAAADYAALSGSLVIPPNAGGAELLIELIDDGEDEAEETLALMLADPVAGAGYQLGDARTHLLRIQDAQIPALSFAPASLTITEGSAAFAFDRMERTATISLAVEPSSRRPLRVRYRVSTRSSARLSKDYSGLPEPGAVSVWAVPASAASSSFSVEVLPDSEPEPDEQLIVELLPSDDGGYVLGEQAVYTLTIRSNGDDGSLPRALFGALGGTVVEGMAFDVPLQVQGFSGPLAVNVVAVGAATTAETGDYSFSGSLTLSSPGGEVLRVQTGQDSDNQDELLVLEFAASTAYDRAINTLAASRFVLHIDDNEPASGQVVQFEDGVSSVQEPARTSTSQHQVFLTRSATAGALDVSLRAVARGGAQSSGSDAADYRLASNTVRFDAGQMRVPVQLTLLSDRSIGDSIQNEDRQEGEQTVELALLPGSGYQLGAQRSHRVRISDRTSFNQAGFCRVADGRDCSGLRITEGDIFYFDTQPLTFGSGRPRFTAVPFEAPVSLYFCVYTSLSAAVSTLRGDNPEFLLLNVERLPGVRCNDVRDAGLTQAYRVIIPAGQNYARVAIEIIDDDKVERGPGGGNAGHRLVAGFTTDPRYPYEVSEISSYPESWRCNADAGDDVGNAALAALCRITDNDQPPAALPRVGFAEVGATVAEAAGAQSVTVNLNPLNLPDPPPPPPGGLVVRYQLGGSPSLELDRDYRIDALDRVTRVGRLVVPPGASSGTLDFSLLDNLVPLQGERVLTLALQPQEGLYEVAGNTVYTLTIQEDDEIGDFVQVRFAQAQLEVNEGSGSAELVVQAIPPPGIAISGSLEVEYRIVFSDTTALPADYTLASSGTLTLSAGSRQPDGSREVTLPVGLIDDSAQDSLPARELVVELVQPEPIQTYVVVPPQRATLVINDDDGANAPVPRVYFERADSALEEGNTAMVRVVAVPPPTGDLTVTYQRMPGGTATAGSDYRTPSGSLTIPRQQGSALLSVELLNNPEDEPEETLLLRLLPPSPGAGYTLGSLRDHLLRIQDAQEPAVSFASAGRTVTEAPRSLNRGLINVQVEVGLTVSPPSLRPLTVRYQVSGSAQRNQDYQGLPANGAVDVLQIAASTTTHTLNFEVPPDELREGVETLVLELLDPFDPADDSYRRGSRPVYTLTINDDPADGNLPQVLFGAADDLRSVAVDAPVLEVNEGEFVDIPVQVSAFSGAFDLSLAVDGTQSNAESGDYTLPAATRIDAAAGTVRLQTNQDVDGDDEVLVLEFAPSAAYQTMPLLVRSSLVVYILDDEAPTTGPVVQFVETSSIVREEQSNNQHQVELTRSGDTSGPLTVSLQAVGRGDVTAGNGDAEADDYNLPSNMVTFAAGQSRTRARLDLFGNVRSSSPLILDLSEGEQVVELALVAGGGYRLGDRRRHQVRIIDRITQETSACFLADGSPCCHTATVSRGCAVGGNTEIREGDTIYFEQRFSQPGAGNIFTLRNMDPILQMPIEFLYCVSTTGRPFERSSRVSHRRSDNPDFLILDAQPVNLGSDPYRGQCSGIGGAQAYRVVGLPGQNRVRITIEIVDDNRVEGSDGNRLAAVFRPSPVTPVTVAQGSFPAELLCNSRGGTGESANGPFCVVIDNDVAPAPLPAVGFRDTGGTVSEDGGMMRIPLDVSPASERGVVVDYALLPTGSALLNQDVVIDGVDGTLNGQVVLFGDGGEIQVLLQDDSVRLGNITLILELRQRAGVYQIAAARNRYTLIIADDD